MKVNRILTRIEDVFCIMAMSALILVSVFVAAEIFSRSFFNKSLPAVYDSIRLLIVLVVFLSVAYTQRAGRHIRVTFFADRVSPSVRKAMEVLNLFIGFVFCAVVSWQAWLFAARSIEIREYWPGTLNLPVYPGKIALCAGVIVLSLRFLVDGIARIRNLPIGAAAEPSEAKTSNWEA